MPQAKHDRCLMCRWSDFGDLKQTDEATKEPIGKCCYDAPAVVVLHFQDAARIELSPRPGVPAREVPGAIHEMVTGGQPIVRASFWCRQFLPADRSLLEKK
jgi:hypothetical protein